MTRILPQSPSLEYLRKEAKHLHRDYRDRNAEVCPVLRLHPRLNGLTDEQIFAAAISLQDVQHALALDYLCDSWLALIRRCGHTGEAVNINDTQVNLLSTDVAPLYVAGQPILGIDIGSSCIKLVQLARKDGHSQLQCFGIEPLVEKAVVETTIEDADAVVAALGRLVQRCGATTRDVALGVSGTKVISKLIEMPASLTDDELEQEICFGADQYIPFPIDEISLFFEVRGILPTNPDSLLVQLTACQLSQVEQLQRVLEHAGLNPVIIDVEAHCIDRVCRSMDLPVAATNAAVFEIGATLSRITVLSETGGTPYTREQLFGLRQLTDEISRRYHVTLAQAEAAVQQNDTAFLPDYFQRVFEPFLEATAEQLKRSLKFFESSTRVGRVEHVVLAGGGATLPGLSDVVRNWVKLPVSVANPFSSVRVSEDLSVEEIASVAPLLTLATGIALRGVIGQGEDQNVGRARRVRTPSNFTEEVTRRDQQAVRAFVTKVLTDAVNDRAELIRFKRERGSIVVRSLQAGEFVELNRPPAQMWEHIVGVLCELLDEGTGDFVHLQNESGQPVSMNLLSTDITSVMEVELHHAS